MQVYKTMSVDLAFMIPQTLCNFIHRITDIDNSGQVGVSETAIMVKGVINPGKAYEAMGSEWLSTPALMTFLKSNRGRMGRKYLGGLCTKLPNCQIPTEEEGRSLEFKHDTSFDALVVEDDESSVSTLSSTPGGHKGLSKKDSIRAGAQAKSLFGPTRARHF